MLKTSYGWFAYRQLRAFIRVKTKKPKMKFCVSGMTNRWWVSGVVINIKVFTMRVNLITFLFHVDFFIEIAIHLPPSLSILMLPLTVLIPNANVSERKQFFLLFFFFLYLITFSFTVWYPQRFFLNYFWIFLEINFSQRVLQTDWQSRDSLFNYVILHV